ncbi:XRE family transcriptional regulator [Actinomadura sp. KC06]|nr:XRE family transcriptional regulator [Actinomadura sp. KC06]
MSPSLGMLVRSARVAHGWTQRDLADRLHCSRSTISRLETGVQALDDVATLRHLAEVLEITPTTLGVAATVAVCSYATTAAASAPPRSSSTSSPPSTPQATPPPRSRPLKSSRLGLCRRSNAEPATSPTSPARTGCGGAATSVYRPSCTRNARPLKKRTPVLRFATW